MENPSPRCVGPKASELCTSESHAPPHACTSFPLSGRQLSKNQTPAAISTRLLRTLLPKPPDASLGESWPRGAMKWKRPEQRRESRRGRRRWCLAAVALWFFSFLHVLFALFYTIRVFTKRSTPSLAFRNAVPGKSKGSFMRPSLKKL